MTSYLKLEISSQGSLLYRVLKWEKELATRIAKIGIFAKKNNISITFNQQKNSEDANGNVHHFHYDIYLTKKLGIKLPPWLNKEMLYIP